MFEIKKILSPFFLPLPVCLELLLVGLTLLWFTRQQRYGKVCVTMATVLLVLVSLESVSGRVLHSIETQFPPLTQISTYTATGGNEKTPVRWIVILAGGVTPSRTLPIQLQVSYDSRVRMLEGIRLYHSLPGSKLVLTGGIGHSNEFEATVLSRYAETLGVSKDDMVLETRSRDTKDHPFHVKKIIENDPFILVTSASHMPRAFRLFAKQGMAPIPAPAGQWEPKKLVWPEYYFPSARGIRLAEKAVHEYLGLGWAWVRGQI